jgi:hypothetical protein
MTNLQIWINNHPTGSEMLWKKAGESQLSFIRDTIPIFFSRDSSEYQNCKQNVVRTHHSKSIELPVVRMEFQNGVTLEVNSNFHTWDLTMELPQAVLIPEKYYKELCSFNPMELDPVYFRNKTIHPHYKDSDKQKFSLVFSSNYEVYAFLNLVKSELNQ